MPWGFNRTNAKKAGILSNKPVQIGLILPYNDTTAPDGFDLFTSANGRRIMGAGSTYSVADTGGDNNLALSAETSDTQGAHTGTTFSAVASGGGGGNPANNGSGGDHSHDFTVASSPLEPNYRQVVLIKANRLAAKFPAKTLALWNDPATDPTGLTQQYTADDDKLFRAGASIASGGTETISAGVTTTTTGNHNHPLSGFGANGTGGGAEVPGALVSHNHDGVTLTFTFAMKRRLLGLWTDAAAEFDVEGGMIAMYESLVPPSGWLLCDGNNGTPDMRDYFLGVSNKANQNSTAGDNTCTCTHPLFTWTHDHLYNPNYIGGGQNYYHNNESRGNHNHTLSFTDTDYFPTYYALSFVMYGG